MSVQGWTYYNHAALPTTPPHELPDLSPIEDGSIWSDLQGGAPVLARWTTDWDCGNETEWWYCIKDTPLDINSLKAKRRYEIKKGQKNFSVKLISPTNYTDDLCSVTIAAYQGWPEKYRPTIDREKFSDEIATWQEYDIFAAFSNDSGKLCGYAKLKDCGSYIEFSVLRTLPAAERLGINAALVHSICEFYESRFDGKFYINDGSRAIRHETAFQNYLEKYFGFRKAFCKLNISYRPGIRLAVSCIYPFRRYIGNNTSIGSKLSAILKMEEIRRSCQ